jgi:hypothetical protein
MLVQSDPVRAAALMHEAQQDVQAHWQRYHDMAAVLEEEATSTP